MSNKVIKVDCDVVRRMNQTTYGEFYSKHSEEDIKRWIESQGGHNLDVDDIFGDGVACLEWEDIDFELETCDISYEGHSGEFPEIDYSRYNSLKLEEYPDKFIHDEKIQEFIDGERNTGVNRIAYQLKDLMNHIDGIKDTSNNLFDELKKILDEPNIPSDDYENRIEIEKKIYQTLKDITQLNSHFPKRLTRYLR